VRYRIEWILDGDTFEVGGYFYYSTSKRQGPRETSGGTIREKTSKNIEEHRRTSKDINIEKYRHWHKLTTSTWKCDDGSLLRYRLQNPVLPHVRNLLRSTAAAGAGRSSSRARRGRRRRREEELCIVCIVCIGYGRVMSWQEERSQPVLHKTGYFTLLKEQTFLQYCTLL
jgi:hypothetical protein